MKLAAVVLAAGLGTRMNSSVTEGPQRSKWHPDAPACLKYTL